MAVIGQAFFALDYSIENMFQLDNSEGSSVIKSVVSIHSFVRQISNLLHELSHL